MAESFSTYKISLKPRSGFHLQNGGAHHESTDAFVRSDTLSAAISYLCFQQYPNSELSFEALPFKFSSLMPAINLPNGNEINLYPRPANQWDVPKQFLAYHKDIKSIKWLSQAVINLLSAGKDLISLLAPVEQLKAVFGNQVYITKEEYVANESFFKLVSSHNLFTNETRQRVTLDRENSASMPYTFSVAYFHKAIQLWAYVDVEPKFENKLKALLHLLSDEGLGGDRTVGLGQFTFESMQKEPSLSEVSATKWMNLGVFSPTDDAISSIDWEEAFFEWTTRRGWTSNGSLRRRSSRALNEGAVFPSATIPNGNVIEALSIEDGMGLVAERLGHPVYRDLRGYFIPIHS